jgi:hypothetical protein
MGRADVEQRCKTLGSGCVCSEPLNNADRVSAEPDRFWNPSDTPASSGKECDGESGGGQAVTMPSDYSTSSMVKAASEVPFPSGANPYVYRTKLGGIQHFQADDLVNVDEETVCYRTYRRYSPGVYMTNVANRIKNIQLGTNTTHANVEHFWDGASAFVTVVDGRYGMDGSRYDGDFQRECQNGWCRIEVCADQYRDTLTYRYYIKHLSNGVTHTFSHGPGRGPASTSFDVNWAQMFVQGSIPGWQYMSHTMLARVPHDPNFQIGASCELEGSCDGSAPAPTPEPEPEPSSPPAAPILLP